MSGEIDSAGHIDTAAWRPQEGLRTGTNACRRAPGRISGCAAYVLTIADRFAAIER